MTDDEKDWWKVLEDNWDDIKDIAYRVYKKPEKLIDKMIKSKTQKNGPAMTSYLNDIWYDAPNEPIIHTWKGWNTLCDLCFEDYILYEGK